MRKSNNKKFDYPEVELGNFVHMCENDAVIKLTCRDIPYPGTFVFYKGTKVGKIDEVLGRMDDSYVTVNLTEKVSFKKDDILKVSAKFIKKEMLMPREKTLQKKEKEEKNRSSVKIQNNNTKRKDNRFNSNGNRFQKNKKHDKNKPKNKRIVFD